MTQSCSLCQRDMAPITTPGTVHYYYGSLVFCSEDCRKYFTGMSPIQRIFEVGYPKQNDQQRIPSRELPVHLL